jgi:hypothetical protein
MKYPKKQFETLLRVTKALSKVLDLKQIHPSSLHYLIYSQFNEGNKHNWLYLTTKGEVKRFHQLSETEKTNATKVVNTNNETFLLCPEGCDDSHCETAIKKILKLIPKQN